MFLLFSEAAFQLLFEPHPVGNGVLNGGLSRLNLFPQNECVSFQTKDVEYNVISLYVLRYRRLGQIS